MAVAAALEAEVSSRTREASKRQLSCGIEKWVTSCCCETPSRELFLSPAPALTCDWDGAQTSLQSYWVISLEWMSQRSISGGDDHEDESRRSSLVNHNL
jgi:hypothetical protein